MIGRRPDVCRLLSLDFEYTLKCPVDKENHAVRFQAYPQLRGYPVDVVECDAKPLVDPLICRKACRGLVESGEFWQRIYPESAIFAGSQ
jgi:hypothetical protein